MSSYRFKSRTTEEEAIQADEAFEADLAASVKDTDLHPAMLDEQIGAPTHFPTTHEDEEA